MIDPVALVIDAYNTIRIICLLKRMPCLYHLPSSTSYHSRVTGFWHLKHFNI